MRRIFRSYAIWACAVVVLAFGASAFYIKLGEPTLNDLGFSSAPISEADKLMMTLALLKKNIREQNLEEISGLIDEDFEEQIGDKKLSKRDMKGIFDELFRTRQIVSRNGLIKVTQDNDKTVPSFEFVETNSSDFEMIIDSVRFNSQDEAIVFTHVQLIGEMKNGKVDKEEKVKFRFQKKGQEFGWKIRQSEKLAKVLSKK